VSATNRQNYVYISQSSAGAIDGKYIHELRRGTIKPVESALHPPIDANAWTEEVEFTREVKIPNPFFDYYLPLSCLTQRRTVYAPIYQKYCESLSAGPYSATAMRSLIAVVSHAFDEDKNFQSFVACGHAYRIKSRELESDTKNALIFVSRKKRRKDVLLGLRSDGEAISETKAALMADPDSYRIMPPFQSIFVSVIIMLLAGLVMGVVNSPTSPLWLTDDDLLGPIVQFQFLGVRAWILVIIGITAIFESHALNSLQHNHVYLLSVILHMFIGWWRFSYWNNRFDGTDSAPISPSDPWSPGQLSSIWFLSQFVVAAVSMLPGRWHALWNIVWYITNIQLQLPHLLFVASLQYMSIVLYLVNLLPLNHFELWRKFSALWDSGFYRQAQDCFGLCRMPLGASLLSVDANEFLQHEKPVDPKARIEVISSGAFIHHSGVVPDERKPAVWPIIGHNALLGAPTPGLHSLYHALAIRNLRLTPKAKKPELWDTVSDQFANHLTSELRGVPWEYSDLRAWADSYKESWKRRDVHKFLDDVDSGDIVAPSDEMYEQSPALRKTMLKKLSLSYNNAFAKTDEVLSFKESALFDGVIGLKPRTIQAVKLNVQHKLQPSMLTAAKRLKIALEEPFPITMFGETKNFWFTFGSGMNGVDLTAWLLRARELAQQGNICSIVCGDDSLTILLEDGQLRYIEIDYSHFDQSQKDVQNLAELKILRALGCSETVTAILKVISRAPCEGKKRNGKVPYMMRFIPVGANRVTGAPNTSLSNSTNNIIGIIIASFYGFSSEGWEAVGFTAKQSSHACVQQATFLRGTWWLHSDGTEHWGILPSAFIKLSKVQTRLDNRTKFNLIARGMILGMGDMPFTFPVLGVYALKVLQICGEITSDVEEIRNKYKPKSDVQSQIDTDSVRRWMCERYDTTFHEIDEFEELLSNIVSLPTFVGHPLLLKMMNDY
jgi:hypothetical protein